jgi:hypothetical protein
LVSTTTSSKTEKGRELLPSLLQLRRRWAVLLPLLVLMLVLMLVLVLVLVVVLLLLLVVVLLLLVLLLLVLVVVAVPILPILLVQQGLIPLPLLVV